MQTIDLPELLPRLSRPYAWSNPTGISDEALFLSIVNGALLIDLLAFMKNYGFKRTKALSDRLLVEDAAQTPAARLYFSRMDDIKRIKGF
jgi:hypothetical protein